MGVYIKDVKMPKNCAECKMWGICDLLDFDDYESICDAVVDGDLVRDKNCPLVEVQTPHGRLIDADELYGAIVDKGQKNERGKYRIGDFWELNGCEIREVIDGQPTIIGAEGSGL